MTVAPGGGGSPIVPELIVAIVSPIGSGSSQVVEAVDTVLSSNFGFRCERISLVDAFDRAPSAAKLWRRVWSEFKPPSGQNKAIWKIKKPKNGRPPADLSTHIRRKALMDMGRLIRLSTKRTQDKEDLLATLAVSEIVERRSRLVTGGGPASRVAFIVKQLKHPKEVALLRRLYGPSFVLIGASTSIEQRIENLKAAFEQLDQNEREDVAKYFVSRDSHDTEEGQRVRETYHLADLFVNSASNMRKSIDRFFKLVFGSVTLTPFRDELAMYLCSSAALASGSLSRQVGAALADSKGAILSLGCNELPKPFGGYVFADDPEDVVKARDLSKGSCTGEREKKKLEERLAPLLRRSTSKAALSASGHFSFIEFYREVHAEAAVLLDSARRGVSVEGATLYTTTFPCHDCAKHILASGIARVIYLEPYPKSKTQEFFEEFIDSDRVDDSGGAQSRISFESFEGVGPNRFATLFSTRGIDGERMDRKDAKGRVPIWTPKFRWRPWTTSYIEDEAVLLREFKQLLDSAE